MRVPRIWHEVPEFADLDALNTWLERRCIGFGARSAIRSKQDARSPKSGPMNKRIL